MTSAGYRKERIDVARATDSEIAELVAFHNVQYGTSRTPAQWRWQYQGYAPEAAVFVVARSGGRLIGTQAAMPIHLNVGGQCMLTGKSENTLLDPAFRGQGVMEDLYESLVHDCRERGMSLLWGFTGAVKAFGRFGFKTHEVVQTWSRPGWNLPAAVVQRLTASRPLTHRLLASGKVCWDLVHSAPQLVAASRRTTDAAVVDAPLVGATLATEPDSWESQPARSVSLPLDDGYLDWRVRAHPFLRYELKQVRAGEALDGFALVAPKGAEHSVVAWPGRSLRAQAALLEYVVTAYQGRASRFVVMENGAAPDARQRGAVLARLGFRQTFVTHLVLRDLSGALSEELAAPGAWRLNGLWTEGYGM